MFCLTKIIVRKWRAWKWKVKTLASMKIPSLVRTCIGGDGWKNENLFHLPPSQEEENEFSPRNTFRRKEKGNSDDKEQEQDNEQEAEEDG